MEFSNFLKNDSNMVLEDNSLLISQIDKALDDIRPFLKVDGGDVEVIGVTENNVVQVRWLGTCQNCSMSSMTMKAGIEQTIKAKLPQIAGVIAINGLSI
jgi:Fe-S cluster biogenesis protein NfuA